ncbi:MAG: tetratricopeptide repeat protein [Gammaproteobacteria bacterium]|nr:tetratricopeptide repeat protein [Gammaproteobacteria bacterium]
MAYKIFQQYLPMVFRGFTYLLLFLFSTAIMAGVDDLKIFNDDKKLFSKAVRLSTQKQWLEAEPIYRDLLKRNQYWPEPGNNLAILLLNTGRTDEALTVLEQAVISSPGYRITQKNRSELYGYLATLAYDKALGSDQQSSMPELELIKTIYQPVKIIEKEVEKEVEKIVIKEVFVEKPQLVEHQQVVEPQQVSEGATQNDIGRHIKQQLLDWSRAWSKGDFDQYIKSYSTDFVPSDARKSYAEWKNIRRARLKFTKGVNVEIEQLRIFVENQGKYVLVEFIQNYRSDSYRDTVLKQMYMQNQQDNWLILSERTIKKY